MKETCIGFGIGGKVSAYISSILSSSGEGVTGVVVAEEKLSGDIRVFMS